MISVKVYRFLRRIVVVVGLVPVLIALLAVLVNFNEARREVAGAGEIAQDLEGLSSDEWGENMRAILEVEGTSIKYPVVQASDNRYYLTRDINGRESVAGSIFLDYRNAEDFSDKYNLIYGHRMSQGGMFTDIEKFFEEEFFWAHAKARLRTRSGLEELQVLAVARVTMSSGVYEIEQRRYEAFEKNWSLVAGIAQWKREADDVAKIYVLSTCNSESQKYRNILLLGG